MLTSSLISGRVFVVSLNVLSGGQSTAVAISGTSAQSAAFSFGEKTGEVVVTPTVDCFVRQGANPTALANGTDQFLIGGNMYRLEGVEPGNKLAFITSGGTGTVYITPSA